MLLSAVTYKHQPGIDASHGAVPLAGTSHVYTVSRVLWPEAVEQFIRARLIGRTLHACCGKSLLGDVRLDLHEESADLHCDAADMRACVGNDAFDTVLCDPPYNGKMQWNHDLLRELARVARCRIIFQHWFIPANREGLYKKAQEQFHLTEVAVWQPRTYFGRAQVISIFDRRPGKETSTPCGGA